LNVTDVVDGAMTLAVDVDRALSEPDTAHHDNDTWL